MTVKRHLKPLTRQQERNYRFLRWDGVNKREIARRMGVSYSELCRSTLGW